MIEYFLSVNSAFITHLRMKKITCIVTLVEGHCSLWMPNLKKEWLCQDMQSAYLQAGCDPKDISRNQYGFGLLPCDSDCKSKVKVSDAELQLRKSKLVEVILIFTSNQ